MALKQQEQVNVQQLIERSRNRKGKKVIEKIVPFGLFLAATISVLTTFGIVFTLIFETFEFLRACRLQIIYLVQNGCHSLVRSRCMEYYH